MADEINKTKAKRLSRGQRIHVRRLKQSGPQERNRFSGAETALAMDVGSIPRSQS